MIYVCNIHFKLNPNHYKSKFNKKITKKNDKQDKLSYYVSQSNKLLFIQKQDSNNNNSTLTRNDIENIIEKLHKIRNKRKIRKEKTEEKI